MIIHGATTADEVYCQFLRSEMYRFRGSPSESPLAVLVSEPDFNDIDQNTARHIFLFSERGPLLNRLPNPVRWHSATMQTVDLEKLRFIRNCG